MFKISEHIYESIEDSSIVISKVEERERKRLLNEIEFKYVNKNKKGKWLWERFNQSKKVVDSNAWTYIKNYIALQECIMFFNQDEDKSMFMISSGYDLDYILSETYGYEFYVTNSECSYLFCFNHHDTLFGCGNAEGYVQSLISTSNC